MYVKIFLKGSVGLFQKRFTSISETQFLKELCVIIKISKKKNKFELKNLKTKMKLREKQGVILIFVNESFKTNLLRRREENFRQIKKQNGFCKTMVEI